MIAYYCPLKAPDHPTPSGDREMARAIGAVLETIAPVRLASNLRTRDGAGDTATQAQLLEQAEAEIVRIAAGPKPRAWVTYHNYYKAPDLLGPRLSAHFGIPYLVIEASRSKRRLDGPWAHFAQIAEDGIDAADAVLFMTDRDRPALEDHRPPAQRLMRLRPFLNRDALPEAAALAPDGPARLLTVGMMRAGDKLESYRVLAKALTEAVGDWRLEIVGDGEMRADIAALFAPFGDRAILRGRLEGDALAAAYRAADLFVWPGVNEGYGIVYLEAQAHGVPVAAEDRPGPRDVIRDGGARAPVGALGALLSDLIADPARRRALGEAGRAQMARDHLREGARRTLMEALT